MPALQVRDFPVALYEELKAYAAANHRSVAQQTIIAVEQMLAPLSLSKDEGLMRCQAGESSLTPREGEWGAVPFLGLTDYDSAARAARIERRKQLFKEFDDIPWLGSGSSTGDIVAMVREGRDYMSERSWRAVDPSALESLWGEEVPL